MNRPSKMRRRLGTPYSSDVVASMEKRVAEIDPLLLEAANDQDVTLIRWHLQQAPLDRLLASWQAASALGRFTRKAE